MPFRTAADGLRLFVRLTPKAAADEVDAVVEVGGEAAIAARVRAVPDKGAANAALLALIAAWLGLPKSRVRLVAGGRSRLKTLALAGDPAELAQRLQSRLG